MVRATRIIEASASNVGSKEKNKIKSRGRNSARIRKKKKKRKRSTIVFEGRIRNIKTHLRIDDSFCSKAISLNIFSF